MKGLAVDLSILNEHPASYIQDLQTAIETAVRSSQSRPRLGQALGRGALHILRADLLDARTRDLLSATARVVLVARRGPLDAQMPNAASISIVTATTDIPLSAPVFSTLNAIAEGKFRRFFGVGRFGKSGRKYVTSLNKGITTSAPWMAENSWENQLTPWSNDPVVDPSGDVFYVCDEADGSILSPTSQPVNDGGRYVARHDFGYSQLEHSAADIGMTLLQYVQLIDPIRLSRLTLQNHSDQPRNLSVTTYCEWVLATNRATASAHICPEIDPEIGPLLARNPFGTAFPGRVAFADLGGRQTEWTADRTAFWGSCGSTADPLALRQGKALFGTAGAGYDTCAALNCSIELPPPAKAKKSSAFPAKPRIQRQPRP